MPLGLPNNVSQEVKRYSDYWGVDGHSHSYLTLRQLTEFDWSQKTKNAGVISAEEYVKWDRTTPEDYCGNIFGNDIIVVSEQDYINKHSNGTLDKDKKYYVQVEWKVTYEETCGYFLGKVIPELKALSNDGVGDDVRIVFWFDN